MTRPLPPPPPGWRTTAEQLTFEHTTGAHTRCLVVGCQPCHERAASLDDRFAAIAQERAAAVAACQVGDHAYDVIATPDGPERVCCAVCEREWPVATVRQPKGL
jgi:hypothetical protein